MSSQSAPTTRMRLPQVTYQPSALPHDMLLLTVVFIGIILLIIAIQYSHLSTHNLSYTIKIMWYVAIALGIATIFAHAVMYPRFIRPISVILIVAAVLAAIGYFIYYLSTGVDYNLKTVNSIIIIAFCLAIMAAMAVTVQSGNYAAFASQTGIARTMLAIIALALTFAFIPHTHSFTTSHPRLAMTFLTVATAIVLYFTKTPDALPFVMPYKIAMIISTIAFITILWYNNPANIFNTTFIQNNATFAIVIAVYLLCLGALYMVDLTGIVDPDVYKSLNIGAGIVTSSLFLIWLIYVIMQLTSKPNTATTFLILAAAIFIAYSLIATVFRFVAIHDGSQSRENALYSLINNTILYLPCVFDSAYTAAMSRMAGAAGSKATAAAVAAATNIKNTPIQIWSLLVIAVGIALAIYYIPSINSKMYIGTGKQLLTDPVAMNGATTVANYAELSGITDASGDDTTTPHYDYKYGISMWYYLDAYGANMSEAYNKYTPIFNYGNKPSIEYNALTNSLRIRVGSAKGEPVTVFEQRGAVQLQKWTNVVVNFIGGTIDIFIDGQLLKSVGGIIPYMSQDNVVVGTQYGLYGKCCNIIYSGAPFTASEIYYLRYLVKDNNPPVFNGKIFR